ncbi:CZB domain-containing protein [Sulfurimonas sp.]|uniref:CZB domain-containing protein n=1 Tax=Sulfurimonas sp. TaxID=2022749 RepID=UPI0035632EFB
MNKEHVLEHLRAAKSAHIKWVQKAKLLINGLDIKEDSIPVDSTECKFGQWFYSEGQILNALSNNPVECMVKIERLHFNLHDVYMNIFNIYFNKPKEGFFSKLFGKKHTLKDYEIEKAKQYYNNLELISKDLLEEINRLERRLIAVPEERIQQLI